MANSPPLRRNKLLRNKKWKRGLAAYLSTGRRRKREGEMHCIITRGDIWPHGFDFDFSRAGRLSATSVISAHFIPERDKTG